MCESYFEYYVYHPNNKNIMRFETFEEAMRGAKSIVKRDSEIQVYILKEIGSITRQKQIKEVIRKDGDIISETIEDIIPF